ncbi:MAG: hypothetical protein PHY24_04075, partial [Candidatus Cloacimonetes bacterium]|nr:hypothetical protein [Candidatus Cloacimonadota bacterium]
GRGDASNPAFSQFFLDAGTHPIQHSPSFFWTRGRIQSSILPVYFGRGDASNPAFSQFILDARRIQSSIRHTSISSAFTGRETHPIQHPHLQHSPIFFWTRDASNPASASPAFSPSKTIPSITHPIIPKIAKKPQNLTKDLTQYAFFSFYQFIINKEKRKNGKIQFDTSAQAPDSA